MDGNGELKLLWGGVGSGGGGGHPRTHAPTHACSKSNMPHQLFQSWGHNYVVGANGHLKISWTSTAELEIDQISRDDLIRVHVLLIFTIYCVTSMVNR